MSSVSITTSKYPSTSSNLLFLRPRPSSVPKQNLNWLGNIHNLDIVDHDAQETTRSRTSIFSEARVVYTSTYDSKPAQIKPISERLEAEELPKHCWNPAAITKNRCISRPCRAFLNLKK